MRRLTQAWVPGDLLPGAERGTWGPTEDTLMSFPVDHDDDKCSCMRGAETGDDKDNGGCGDPPRREPFPYPPIPHAPLVEEMVERLERTGTRTRFRTHPAGQAKISPCLVS